MPETITIGAPSGMSVRSVPFQLRSEVQGDGLTFEGYAAVFDSPTQINDWDGEYEEVIARGAFKRTLEQRTPVLQFDHGQHPVLGSMPIGSITSLREDPHGLLVQARLLDNWMTEPLRQAISSGAIDGMSFRFQVIQDNWSSDRSMRTVKEVKLFELGPVVFPAYSDTTASLRSLAAHVPGLTLTYERGQAPVEQADADPGTSDEPASARTSDELATPDSDPVDPDHSVDIQRRRDAHARSVAEFEAHIARLGQESS
jgi:HK97 family phage prohead protease